MFLPVRDLNPTRSAPYLTWALIVINLAVFVLLTPGDPALANYFNRSFGVVPARLLADPVGEAWTIASAAFMHASWAHLAGNLLFLHIFGDNVEDALGRLRFALFYAASALGAAVAQVLVDPASSVPMVGASGAISGVLGGYLVLYPKARVLMLNLVPLLWLVVPPLFYAPAWVVLSFWLVFQNLLPGLTSLLPLADDGPGGVAFFAHLGGFLTGILLIRLMCGGRPRPQPDVWHGWRPPPDGRTWRAPQRWNPPGPRG